MPPNIMNMVYMDISPYFITIMLTNVAATEMTARASAMSMGKTEKPGRLP